METANILIFLHNLKTVSAGAAYAERARYHTWLETNTKLHLLLFYQYLCKSMKINRIEVDTTGGPLPCNTQQWANTSHIKLFLTISKLGLTIKLLFLHYTKSSALYYKHYLSYYKMHNSFLTLMTFKNPLKTKDFKMWFFLKKTIECWYNN